MPRITTHPREGTETPSCWRCILRPNYNSSPRGDGNVILAELAVQLHNYNSSPRGDGNDVDVCATPENAKLQLIPARGRKLTGLSTAHGCPANYNSSPRGDGNCAASLTC